MEEIASKNLVVIQPTDMDVFETSDLPEDDQHSQIVLNEPPSSDCIEPIKVSIHDAFQQFRGKTLEATGVDFSDDISRARNSGYSAHTVLHEQRVDGQHHGESLEQKCQRLQQELRELAKEVDLIKENIGTDASGVGLSPMELVKQTEYLQRQMIDLTMENQFGLSGTLSDPQGALQRRLLTELNGFQKSSTDTTSLKPTSMISSDSDHVSYQLFYRPEQAKFCNNARIADFEQRIEQLEAVLGHSPEKLSLLTSELSNKTITSALCMLLAKMKVIDPGHLDLLEPRLTTVYQKVSRMTDKKEAGNQSERLNKVTELLDLVKKADAQTGSLLSIVDRLSALGLLHKKALQMSETLMNLDVAQRQINDQLVGDVEMLKQFQELVIASMAMMESNGQNLKERLMAVEKK